MRVQAGLRHFIFYASFLVFISHTGGYVLELVQGKQPAYLSFPGAFSVSQSFLLYDRNEIFTWRYKLELIYPGEVVSVPDSIINRRLSSSERHLFTLGDYTGSLARVKEPLVRYYFCDLSSEILPFKEEAPLSVRWIFSDRTETRVLAEVPCRI